MRRGLPHHTEVNEEFEDSLHVDYIWIYLISGLRWLVSEHKKCVGQLEHLKSAIADMHRWIDLIHERGEAMYKAFAELRSHLEDIQSRIEHLHRANHDDRETTDRLKKELEDWKEKCRRVNVELEDVRARYERMEKEHSKMLYQFGRCQRETSGCKRVSNGLGERLDALDAEARELQGRLMDAERYREMVSKANMRIRQLMADIERLGFEIGESKKTLTKCRVEVVNAKSYQPPGFNKDTHVNLDMQMWITHNQTRERAKYTPLIQYIESPPQRKQYETPYKQAPIQQPQVYTSVQPTSTSTSYITTTTTTLSTTTTMTTTTTSTTSYTKAVYGKVPSPLLKPTYHPAESKSLSKAPKYY